MVKIDNGYTRDCPNVEHAEDEFRRRVQVHLGFEVAFHRSRKCSNAVRCKRIEELPQEVATIEVTTWDVQRDVEEIAVTTREAQPEDLEDSMSFFKGRR
jgi:hypothetical protein